MIAVHDGEPEARDARHRYGLTLRTPVPDIVRLVEHEARVHVALIRLDADGFDGAYRRDRGTGFVLVNGARSPVRQRFTLAHEFGHHELGHVAALDRRIEWNAKGEREVAANWFAAEFLAPREAVRAWFEARIDRLHSDRLVDIALLASHFGVSCQVALYRADAAGVLNSGRQKSALEERIRAREHASISVRSYKDSLSELHQTWRAPVRMPQQTIDDVVGAVIEGVLDRRTAAAQLMIPDSELAALVADREPAE